MKKPKRLKNKFLSIKERMEKENNKQRNLLEAAMSSQFGSYLSVLEDYLIISKSRSKNPMSLGNIQMSMLLGLVTFQNSTTIVRKKIRLSNDDKEKEELNAQLSFFKLVVSIIKNIADGIVWRLFDYKRADIRAISDKKHHSGHIQSGKGLRKELEKWAYVFDSGKGIAFMNDLSNCLRIGDISIFQPNGDIIIEEIKAGEGAKKGSRILRQTRERKRVIEFLSERGGIVNNQKVEISSYDIPLKNMLKDVLKLINKAKKKGISYKKFGDYLIVECLDYNATLEYAESKVKNTKIKIKDKKEHLMKKWNKKMIRSMSNKDIIGEFCKNVAPYSIFPFPIDIRLGLMSGLIFLKSYLNLEEIIKMFERDGWTVELEDMNQQQYDFIFTLSKDKYYFKFPFVLLLRIMSEFLCPSVLLDSVNLDYERSEYGRSKGIAPSFDLEHQLWD